MRADPGLQLTCVRAGVKHAVVFQGPFWGQKGPLKYIQHLANICREAFQMSLSQTINLGNNLLHLLADVIQHVPVGVPFPSAVVHIFSRL